MRAWLYLLAAGVAGGIVLAPALLVLFLIPGQGFDDALVASLATLMLVSGIAVVSMRDIIRCGLAMIVCFLALAGLYVTLGAAMVAAAQVIVYIGAISVLILFAIMLTQTKDAPARLVFQTQAGPAAIAAIVIAIVIALSVAATEWPGIRDVRIRYETEAMSKFMFDNFVLPFEIISVLLLAAVIGGVFLAKREPGGPS